ncbi:hypothetical protein JTY93_15435 [Pseudomonas hygromyciniae]|uniref:Uncharacterized protein n=1 Tax=Pseudomonas hygromyciniae TaxID=2812000 RepID=A0ABX7JU81_9PSED|nr:hypothetical protein [Pseudomonas hygromyciniae]MBN0975951.1 hypothetical protein [Pseudomonas hygromyciniae]QSB37728.1 hypothetical protein JTY93_15435 [Pseudomonas hygromyciniae]HAY43640.1 hypothetical protein [Micrococcaceae bacterium]
MDNDGALWLIAQVLSAACLSMEEGMTAPNNRDLPLARELAANCGDVLKKHAIAVFAITETGSKVQLPANQDVIRGREHFSKIVAERSGSQSEIDTGTIKMHSTQFEPGIWERSELSQALAKAFRLVG